MVDDRSSQTNDSANDHEIDSDPKAPPRVFVSYTHEDSEHKAWVASLSTDLRRKGVDAVLDQWKVTLGADLTLFMEEGIRGSDRVLLICTPVYARKANEGQGGVGYERLVVTGEIAENIATDKFICVLRRGTKDDALPSFAKTRKYVDFRESAKYDCSLEELLRDIHKAPAQPEPSLGTTPFASDDSAPDRSSVTLPSVDVTQLLDIDELGERAEHILRSRDLLGWRRLVRRLRQVNHSKLVAWRDGIAQSPVEKDEWLNAVHAAIDAIAPYFVLALTAIESGIEQIRDQRALIYDLISPRDWKRSRERRVVDTPEALAMAYHYVVGAFLVESGQHSEALEFIVMPIQSGSSEPQATELWRHTELIAWSDALDGNCAVSWRFLQSLLARHGWLASYFVDEVAFVKALRAYQLLASVTELAEFVSRGEKKESALDNLIRFDIPPMFLIGDENGHGVGAVLALAIPDEASLALIAERFKVGVSDLVEYWPWWFRGLVAWFARSFPRSFCYVRAAPPLVPGADYVPFENLRG